MSVAKSIQDLQSKRETLQSKATDLEQKVRFWHTAAWGSAGLSTFIGILAFIFQNFETRRTSDLNETNKDVTTLTEKSTALQIEQERTARIELLKQLAPRGLNLAQIGEIRQKLYPQFHTVPIDIVFYSGDFELAAFASNLSITFTAWHPGMLEVYREFTRGVTIDYDPNDKAASEAAQPFFDALKPYGFRLSGPFPTLSDEVPYLIGDKKPKAKLRITVGWKDAPAVSMADMTN